MISQDLRSMSDTLAEIGKVRPATPNECISMAIVLLSLANRVDAMECAVIPQQKRNLTVIIGGKPAKEGAKNGQVHGNDFL